MALDTHQRAITAINEMFDRLDDLQAARDRLIGAAPLGPHDDPVRDAEDVLDVAGQLEHALAALRQAALPASVHRRRTELAGDIGTKVGLLFQRDAGDAPFFDAQDDSSGARPSPSRPAVAAAAPATGGPDDG
jgi:hypothetical protein